MTGMHTPSSQKAQLILQKWNLKRIFNQIENSYKRLQWNMKRQFFNKIESILKNLLSASIIFRLYNKTPPRPAHS